MQLRSTQSLRRRRLLLRLVRLERTNSSNRGLQRSLGDQMNQMLDSLTLLTDR